MLLAGCVVQGPDDDTGESEAALVIPTEYVALGDSYSSGHGTRDYFDNACKRSNHAYVPQLAAERGYNLKFVACSGAKVPDVRSKQLSALSAATGVLTISIGGNDSGFANVVTACAKPWPSTCWDEIDAAQAYVANKLPAVLGKLYKDIRTRAPNAEVVVVGYPRPFNGEECNPFARLSHGEQVELNQTADLLSYTIESLAAAHGFIYVDPRNAVAGHAVCDDDEWVNGLSNPVDESYHPNKVGHDSYTDLISWELQPYPPPLPP